MGDLDKTTALKAICSAGSFPGQFEDGICLRQFSQDAKLQKFRKDMCKCVQNFGVLEIAKEMRRASSLRDVANRAEEWLKGKAVLLVLDDL